MGRNIRNHSIGISCLFERYCSGVKGRKGQHVVGLAVDEDIVKNVGKDGIPIE